MNDSLSQVWEDFVVSSQRSRNAPKINTWTLIRASADESRFGTSSTNSSIEPFSTGFKDMAVAELEAYFTDLQKRFRANVGANVFAVLDNRSIDDQTALVNHVCKFDDMTMNL